MIDTHTIVLRRPLLQEIMFEAAGRSWTLSYWNNLNDHDWWKEMAWSEQSKRTVEKVLEKKFKSFAGCRWGKDPTDRIEVLVTDRNEALMFKLGVK